MRIRSFVVHSPGQLYLGRGRLYLPAEDKKTVLSKKTENFRESFEKEIELYTWIVVKTFQEIKNTDSYTYLVMLMEPVSVVTLSTYLAFNGMFLTIKGIS